jgi:hypothetical protein
VGIPFDLSIGVFGNPLQDSSFHRPRPVDPCTFAVVLPGPNDRQDSTFPGGKCGRAADAHFPADPARVRHASEGDAIFSNHDQTTELNPMPRNQKPGSARIDLDISVEAKLRFASLHESLGYKTKTETFEAILYFVSTKDKIDPSVLDRIEDTLKHHTQILESLS